MQRAKRKIRNGSVMLPVGIGLGVSIAVMILGVCIGALFISNEYLRPAAMIYVSVIIQFLASFVGTLTAGKLAGENMLPVSLIAGGSYFAILIAVALLFFEGIAGGVIWGIAAVLAGVGGAIVLCSKAKLPPRRKRRRVATR